MRSIIQNGDQTLRQIAQPIPVEEIESAKIQTLIREMKLLLAKEEYGVAIAAPQVGESLRLFIVAGKVLVEKKRRAKKPEGEHELDTSELPSEDAVYINPELVKISRGKTNKHEGCLSVRGKWGIVPRAEKTTVRAFNEKGEQFTRGASGFLAHIFQHELDHLEGILYIDKAVELYDEKKETA